MTNYEKAFNELKKMNIAVQKNWGEDKMHEDRGYFWIWCEGLTDETSIHIDYYNNFEGSTELRSILDKYDLYFEWENGAAASVYDA